MENPIYPEMLVQRFGEYLVETGLIQPADLERALEYQQQETPMRHVLLGQALVELGVLDRDTLEQALARKLAGLQNALLQANLQLEERVQQRTQDLERQLVQIRTAAEITQVALSGASLGDLLSNTVNLLEERFGYTYVAIYLVDEVGRTARLREATGQLGKALKAKEYSIEVGANSVVGWVLEQKQPKVDGGATQQALQVLMQAPNELLVDFHSEACLPIMIGSRVLGALDVQHTTANAFDTQAVAILQTVTNHIASVIENYYLLEVTRGSLNEVSTLYQASYQMARAVTPDEVMRVASTALKQAAQQPGQLAAYLIPEPGGLWRVAVYELGLIGWGTSAQTVAFPEQLALTSEQIEQLFVPGEPYLVKEIAGQVGNAELPAEIIDPLIRAGYKELALIPSRRSGKLEIVFLLALREPNGFRQTTLQSYAGLAELTSATLEKVYSSQRMEKRLTALQSLNTISQAVSVETDLMVFYQVVHRETTSVIGNVNFAIATYDALTDTIEIPYMFDGKDVRSVERFPAGESLTSIIIRTRQPMMFVKDTERKTRELGAKMVGKPAKSWLGVPLLIAGQAIGAIIVQDLEREGRFDEDDQRLLTTLASQVAVAIRNARMLEATYHQAAQERRLYEISKNVRGAPDIPGIMQVTAQELSKILGARRVVIELGSEVLPAGLNQREESSRSPSMQAESEPSQPEPSEDPRPAE